MSVHIITYAHIDDHDAKFTLTFTDGPLARQVTESMKLEGFATKEWFEREVTEYLDAEAIKAMCAAELKDAAQYRQDEAAANA